MKLRLRSLETKETHKLDLPDNSTLDHLKQTLSHSISAAPSSSLRLSLNRRDELLPSSPSEDSLASLGLTSGDLVFYSLQALTPDQAPETQTPIPQTLIPDEGNLVISEEAKAMKIDGEETSGTLRKKYSVSFFLRRVMREEEELTECRSSGHKLLVIALHAVLSESRFLRFDSVSGERIGRCCLPEDWPAVAYTLSLSYTLPEILMSRENGLGGVEAVVLKIQTLGQFVNVYGSLIGGRGETYRVCLDVERVAPMLDYVWGSRNVSDDEVFVPEAEIFEFWRIVNDGITYPLLIDLCEKAALPQPASFVRLPLDIKMNILERLSGADIVKAGGVCKELQNLASNDELWKLKFKEEFGGSENGGTGNWKFLFAGKSEDREREKKAMVMWRDQSRIPFPPMRRESIPFAPGFPVFIADPPGFGVPDPLRRPRIPYPLGAGPPVIFRHGRRTYFSPNCNLGGFSG